MIVSPRPFASILRKRLFPGMACVITAVMLYGIIAPVKAAPALDAITAPAPKPSPKVARLIKDARSIDPTKHWDQSIVAWRAALSEAEKMRPTDPMTLATIRNGIADPMYYRTQNGGLDSKDAVAMVEPARTLLEQSGLMQTALYIDILSNLGVLYASNAQMKKAEEAQRRGIAIGEALYGRDDPRIANNYFNFGYFLYRAGAYEEAAHFISKAVPLNDRNRPAGHVDTISFRASGANVLADAGRLTEATAMAREAVVIAERHLPRDHPWVQMSLAALGDLYRRTGKFSEALAPLQKATEQIGAKPSIVTQRALVALAQTLGALGRFEEARQMAKASVDVSLSVMLTTQGHILRSQYSAELGDMDTAMAAAKRAKDASDFLKQTRPSHPEEANVLANLADLYLAAGDIEQALPLALDAERISAERLSAAHPALAAARIRLGYLMILRGQIEAGRAMVNAAADVIAADLMAPELNNETLVQRGALFQESFARVALASARVGDMDRAFRAMQLANYGPTALAMKQVAIREAAAFDPAVQNLIRALQDGERALHSQRTQRDAAIAGSKTAATESLSIQITDQSQRNAGLRREITGRFPDFERLSLTRPESLAALQSRLAKDEAVLMLLPERQGLLALSITAKNAVLEERPVRRANLHALVSRIRASVDSAAFAGTGGLPDFDDDAAHRLYQAIFGGTLTKSLSQVRRLRVMAAGDMGTIPLAALLVKPLDTRVPRDIALRRAHWLVRDMALVTPAAFGDPSRRANAIGARSRFIGFGAPSFTGKANTKLASVAVFRNGILDLTALRDLPALPSAAAELQNLGSAFDRTNSHIFLGKDATESAVKSMDYAGVSVIAFATHGLLSSDISGLGEPALAFTPPDKASARDGGLLTASEVAGLNLDADWIILSACNSAAGVNDGERGYRGLAQAFLYAGGRSLLVSHWNVRDDAAARLTVDSIKGQAGGKKDRAQALRTAMLRLIADKSVPQGAHPAVWAPFILIE